MAVMKKIVVHIPDNKYAFFIELLKNFDFISIEEKDMDIPEDQKEEVRSRIKKSDEDPSRLMDWDEAKKKINY
jgi:predicted small metal-binding protein